MVQKSQTTTVWMYPKPCKSWDKLPTSTGERRISETSRVVLANPLGNIYLVIFKWYW